MFTSRGFVNEIHNSVPILGKELSAVAGHLNNGAENGHQRGARDIVGAIGGGDKGFHGLQQVLQRAVGTKDFMSAAVASAFDHLDGYVDKSLDARLLRALESLDASRSGIRLDLPAHWHSRLWN